MLLLLVVVVIVVVVVVSSPHMIQIVMLRNGKILFTDHSPHAKPPTILAVEKSSGIANLFTVLFKTASFFKD